MPRRCSVKDCTADAKHNYKFPRANTDKERFLKWLAASGNSCLLKHSPRQLRNKGICMLHFEPKYKLAKKLTTSAVPTLHLPDKIDVSNYKTRENTENESPNKRFKNVDVIQTGPLYIDMTNEIQTTSKKRLNDDVTYFRSKSVQQDILPYEEESPNNIAFHANTEKSLVKELLFTVQEDGERECTANDLKETNLTVEEDRTDNADLNTAIGQSAVEKILSSVPKNEKTKDKKCTLCKAFLKAKMRTHLLKLQQAMEGNCSEDTKDFVRNQLQAIITAIFNRSESSRMK